MVAPYAPVRLKGVFPISQLTRRGFLQAAAASAAFPLITIAGTKSSARVLGANDVIRVGVAGINGRGGSHIGAYLGEKNVQIAYLIDPDSSLFAGRSRTIEKKSGKALRCVQDIRQALEDKDLDVISVATTNHWHSLITIWSCQAGKDVYVEKPISHNVTEGRRCVEFAHHFGRMVQHGTQQRSEPGRANEIAAVHSGKYGKLLVAKGYASKPRPSIGTRPVEQPPAALDFNIWLGPAPQQPFHRNLVHYNWHWFWDFGNGEIGNQGVHQMDFARWGIQGATLPTRVWSLGGRFGYKDQGQTPNTQMAVYEFGDVLLVFEVRGLVLKDRSENEFYTTEGRIYNGRFYPNNGRKSEPLAKFDVHVTPGGPFGSFLHAVRCARGKTSTPPPRRPIIPPPCATWATSPTAWASPFPSTRRPTDWATIAGSSKPSTTCRPA